jgi:hypothetical protein
VTGDNCELITAGSSSVSAHVGLDTAPALLIREAHPDAPSLIIELAAA